MQRLYVGDVGVIVEVAQPMQVPDIDIDSLSNDELFALAIECGMQPKTVIGIVECIEHVKYKKLHGLKIPDGMTYLENVVYCNNCWEYFLWKP